MEYIKENPEVISELYKILINNDNINTIRHTLGILILICEYLKEQGVEILCRVIEDYSRENDTPLYKELVKFLNDSSTDIKTEAMTLICQIIKYNKDKNKVEFINNTLKIASKDISQSSRC
jgi:hypothetical protein